MASPELQGSAGNGRGDAAPAGGRLAGLIPDNNATDSDYDVDVVFVHGIDQDPEGCPVEIVGGTFGYHVFTYSADAITHCGGLDDLAHRLLSDILRLRTCSGSETDRPLGFVSHDYGGTIVKRALVIASRIESFAKLLSCTWALVFLGCPHRCDRDGDLEEKFVKLLKARRGANAVGLTRLASVMAETTWATNAEFIGTNVLSRVRIFSRYSGHDDDSLRIFDQADVCFLVPLESRWRSRLSHANLPNSGAALRPPALDWFKDGKRQALLRMSSPIYPLATHIPDRSELDCLTSGPSFLEFQQRGSGISVLEVFGHGDARTAAEYIFHRLDTRSEESGAQSEGRQDRVLFFQFNCHDARFRDIGCMLRTMIAQIARHIGLVSVVRDFGGLFAELTDGRTTQIAKHAGLISAVRVIGDRMAELADDRSAQTDSELYDFLVHLLRAADKSLTWLVLSCLDQCDVPSRSWFLSRLSSSIAAAELPWKLVVTHNRTDSGDEMRTALFDLGSSGHCQRLITQEETAESKVPVLYSLNLDEVGFTASSNQCERPSAPLAVRDSLRYPQSAELWSRLGGMAEVQDALATWIELNRKNAEKLAATLLLQPLTLSFALICKAILDAVPAQKQQWARGAMAWLALSFRPLTVEEAAALIGIPSQGLGEPDRLCSGSDFMAALRKHFGGLFHVVHGEVWGGPKLWQTVGSASREPGTEALWYEFADDSQGHGKITKMCLQYLSRPGMQDALEKLGSAGQVWADDAQDETGPDTRLLAYATTNWPLHYRESSFSLEGLTASGSARPDDAVVFLADDKLREPWARAYHAVTHGSAKNTASGTFSSLQVCGWFGFDHLLHRFGGGAGKQAWQQAAIDAAAYGRIETLRFIFDIEPAAGVGLDPSKAIKAAMSSNNDEVILEVLNKLPVETDCSQAWVSDLLLQSSRLGFTAVVRKLLGPPWNASHSAVTGFLRPLHYAAQGDHLEIAKLLLDAGADVEGIGDGPYSSLSPLAIACKSFSPQVAEFLVGCGAETDTIAGVRGWTPLQFAAFSGCLLAVKSILSRDSIDNYEPDKNHPAALAAAQGNWRCVEALCLLADDFEMVVDGKTLLSLAVNNGDIDMARMLLRNGARLGGQHAEAQATLLHTAVKQNNNHMAALLVNNGADVNAKDKSEGSTPLWLAARQGLTDMAEYLLDNGAEVDNHCADGETPSYRASYNGHAETLELLLLRGADVEGTLTDNGLRPIHAAYDSAETMRVLLRHGAECNKTSPWGTPLHAAVRNNCSNTVRVLLDDDIDGRRGRCDLEAEDDGETALEMALHIRNDDIALRLLDAGANVNRTILCSRDGTCAANPCNISPLHMAVFRNNTDLVAKMLQCRASVDTQDATGNTPLNRILRDTSVHIVRALLCAGADVESVNKRGYTPVWTALQAGNVAVSRLLLGKRCRAKVGTALLRWACMHGSPALIEDVVRLGRADVNIGAPGSVGPPLQAVCYRPKSPLARPPNPATTGTATTNTTAAAAGDMTPRAAEIVGLMKILLEKGAELNTSEPSKSTLGYSINAACLAAPFGVVRFLIRDCGARVDVCDSMAQRTPLHLACYRDARFVDAVLSAHVALARASGEKTDPPSTATSPGSAGGGAAGLADDAVTVSNLLSSVRDVTGRLPLHYAAASGNPDLVSHVLDKIGIVGLGTTVTESESMAAAAADLRAVVNDKDAQGWTPLHWAARAASRWLSDRDDENSRGVTDYAAVAQLLIDRGSDPEAATAQGPIGRSSRQMWTPLDVARYHNAPTDVLSVLATAADTGISRPGLRKREISDVKPAKTRSRFFCESCFLYMVGAAYKCTRCEYHLCFVCYGSRDRLHSPPHSVFIDIDTEDDSDDTEDTDSDAEEEEMEEEEAEQSTDTRQRSASPDSGELSGDDEGD